MSVSGDYLSVPLCCVVCVGVGGDGDVVRGGGGGGERGVSVHTSVSFSNLLSGRLHCIVLVPCCKVATSLYYASH